MRLCNARCVALLLIVLNVWFSELSFGQLDRWLKWSDQWGTERAKIWKYSLDYFASLPRINQVFGGGPSGLYYYDIKHMLFHDAVLDNAHNEYLQYLICNGVCGLIAYMLLVTHAILSICFNKNNPERLSFLCAIVGYCAWSMVGISQPMTTPYFFMIIGLSLENESVFTKPYHFPQLNKRLFVKPMMPML